MGLVLHNLSGKRCIQASPNYVILNFFYGNRMPFHILLPFYATAMEINSNFRIEISKKEPDNDSG